MLPETFKKFWKSFAAICRSFQNDSKTLPKVSKQIVHVGKAVNILEEAFLNKLRKKLSKSYPKAAHTNFTKLSKDHLQFLIGVALGSCFFSTPIFYRFRSASVAARFQGYSAGNRKWGSTIHWGSASPPDPENSSIPT